MFSLFLVFLRLLQVCDEWHRHVEYVIDVKSSEVRVGLQLGEVEIFACAWAEPLVWIFDEKSLDEIDGFFSNCLILW